VSIEIRTVGGTVLYTAESATDVRHAVTEAVAARANLRGADLHGTCKKVGPERIGGDHDD